MVRAAMVLIASVAACASAAGPAKESLQDGLCAPTLRLTVKEVPRPAWYRGSGPMVVPRLENSGPAPVRLRSGAHFRFEIRDSTGRELPYAAGPPNVIAEPTSYMVLSPGASIAGEEGDADVSARDDLSARYQLLPGHEYTVRGQLIDRYGYPTFEPPAPGVCFVSSPPIVVVARHQ